MIRDDIIRMAREAGLTGLMEGGLVEYFERFAALVAAAEREARAEEPESHRAWVDAAMVKVYDFADAYCSHRSDGEADWLPKLNKTRSRLREHLYRGRPKGEQ